MMVMFHDSMIEYFCYLFHSDSEKLHFRDEISVKHAKILWVIRNKKLGSMLPSFQNTSQKKWPDKLPGHIVCVSHGR